MRFAFALLAVMLCIGAGEARAARNVEAPKPAAAIAVSQRYEMT